MQLNTSELSTLNARCSGTDKDGTEGLFGNNFISP